MSRRSFHLFQQTVGFSWTFTLNNIVCVGVCLCVCLLVCVRQHLLLIAQKLEEGKEKFIYIVLFSDKSHEVLYKSH